VLYFSQQLFAFDLDHSWATNNVCSQTTHIQNNNGTLYNMSFPDMSWNVSCASIAHKNALPEIMPRLGTTQRILARTPYTGHSDYMSHA